MAKSKNHTSHNQSNKAHRNGEHTPGGGWTDAHGGLCRVPFSGLQPDHTACALPPRPLPTATSAGFMTVAARCTPAPPLRRVHGELESLQRCCSPLACVFPTSAADWLLDNACRHQEGEEAAVQQHKGGACVSAPPDLSTAASTLGPEVCVF